MTLRFLTAGESHGPALVGILEGIPAGLELSEKDINVPLERRQGGYGRSKRMNIEQDQIEIVGGVWKGRTSGSPIALILKNKAVKEQDMQRARTKPRPGHADFAGASKYDLFDDFNPVIERASARETAMRVAIGAVTQKLLRVFDIEVFGHVVAISKVQYQTPEVNLEEMKRRRNASQFYCLTPEAEEKFKAAVDDATEKGDTLGGIVEILGCNIPPGLGSYAHYDRRLDARIAFHLLSIPSCKGMEIGEGIRSASLFGSEVHDPFLLDAKRLQRSSNNAGGIEGGVTNGEHVVVRAYFKPISTLRKPLPTVDFATGKTALAPYIRSDITVVPAASVIAESLVSFVIAGAFLERFGGDTIPAVKDSYETWKEEYKKKVSFETTSHEDDSRK